LGTIGGDLVKLSQKLWPDRLTHGVSSMIFSSTA
jgi:hypothetical protein